MAADRPEREGLLHELEAWVETPMLVLSGVWLVLLIVELTWGGSPLVVALGTVIWGVFVLEFLLRLALAPDKLRFIGRNLLTVLALVVPAFRLLRVVRVLRFARLARFARGATLVRVVAGANRSMTALRRTMKRRGLGYVVALTLVICLLGTLGMRAFEAGGPSAESFDSFGDALWWTAMILTTMGSQAWPATPEGRLLAFLLSFYAFAVFGYVAAAFASFFVDRDRDAAETPQLEELRAQIAALSAELRASRSPGPALGPGERG
ncbi:MAG: potassium channel family protein [Pseudomonadota bacterium]|nr:potassium channel family protein [Pseudomonadota bacterium]